MPGGAGTITFELYKEDGRVCCGILTLEGELKLPPKAWLRTMRDGLKYIEGLARDSGAQEMRIAGRSWARVFPDYSPYDGPRNGLRKEL